MSGGTIYSEQFDKVIVFNEQASEIARDISTNSNVFSKRAISLLKEVDHSKLEIAQKTLENAVKSSNFNGELRSACGHLESIILEREKAKASWVNVGLSLVTHFATLPDPTIRTARLLCKLFVLLALFRQRIGDSVLKEEALEKAAKYVSEIEFNFYSSNDTQYLLTKMGKGFETIDHEKVVAKCAKLISSYNTLAVSLQSSRRLEVKERRGVKKLFVNDV